jgi:hypothetical protein
VEPRSAALASLALLAGLSAACTSQSAKPATAPRTVPSTGPAATMSAKPVNLRIRVTRVAGRLSGKDQTALAHNVGGTISGYFQDAFVGGAYPRSDFGNAFATFSAGAGRTAQRDRDLLTNAALGPTTQSVTPKRMSAYLSVLAPNKVAAGVDARVDLVYVADRGDKAAQRVEVSGRLTLTRKKNGGWQIFGYHLSRSATAATNGAS